MNIIKQIIYTHLYLFVICNAKTILVTGGTGFIGSHLTTRLLERNDTVIITTKASKYSDFYDFDILKKKSKNNLKIYEMDITSKSDLEIMFQQEKIDVICHLAAKSNIQESIIQPEIYCENIKGTLLLLDMAVKYKVPHFVFASSSAVYGNCPNTPFDEIMKTSYPCNLYAVSKITGELLTYTYHHLYGLNCTCLRLFNVYGPGDNKRCVFIFLNSIYSGKQIKLKKNGMIQRDFVYIDDVIDALIRAVDNPYNFTILNIGTGKTYSLTEIIKLLEQYLDRNANILQIDGDLAEAEITCADISRARQVLGFEPTITLQVGLEKTVQWFKEKYLKIKPS